MKRMAFQQSPACKQQTFGHAVFLHRQYRVFRTGRHKTATRRFIRRNAFSVPFNQKNHKLFHRHDLLLSFIIDHLPATAERIPESGRQRRPVRLDDRFSRHNDTIHSRRHGFAIKTITFAQATLATVSHGCPAQFLAGGEADALSVLRIRQKMKRQKTICNKSPVFVYFAKNGPFTQTMDPK